MNTTTYTTCSRCGEPAPAALHWQMSPVLCRNCVARGIGYSTRHVCTVCGFDGPAEAHHVASRISYPDFTCWLCPNCHTTISSRQYSWRRDGSDHQYPFRYLLVGVVDLLRLFLERSPVAYGCRQLFALLAEGALLALGALGFPALSEVGYALSVIEDGDI